MGSHEHVPPYAALPPLDSQRIEVLRLLGRLELMDGPTLFQTLYAGRASHTTLKRDLLELYQHRLVWRTTAPPTARSLEQVSSGRTGRVGGRRRYIYGLSDEGRTLLDSLGVEPDARSLAALKSRDPRGRYKDAREPGSLAHPTPHGAGCAGGEAARTTRQKEILEGRSPSKPPRNRSSPTGGVTGHRVSPRLARRLGARLAAHEPRRLRQRMGCPLGRIPLTERRQHGQPAQRVACGSRRHPTDAACARCGRKCGPKPALKRG
ncbi:MAG: hypothetical protein EI684_01590 [Candidatus Viridilinea halotolerans]|uniref:Uncharacterized protein n=1 Tax=Candidatus Viridilinea halotolerans TaxID=2491704 RepID=A0A426UAB6_9CHLR|nr:MAG: hypothetical protein EI684_01590 [Candidatus Viridilinea halotolerans]